MSLDVGVGYDANSLLDKADYFRHLPEESQLEVIKQTEGLSLTDDLAAYQKKLVRHMKVFVGYSKRFKTMELANKKQQEKLSGAETFVKAFFDSVKSLLPKPMKSNPSNPD